MARSRKNIRLPIVGKLNLKSPNTWLLAGGVALAGLWFLASTGKQSGVQFIDRAADQFEDIYEDYVWLIRPSRRNESTNASQGSTSCTISRCSKSWDDLR